MARLSAELGLRVAVEGVETEEQLDLVAAEDSVDEVQGFLFGAAMPSQKFAACCSHRRSGPARLPNLRSLGGRRPRDI